HRHRGLKVTGAVAIFAIAVGTVSAIAVQQNRRADRWRDRAHNAVDRLAQRDRDLASLRTELAGVQGERNELDDQVTTLREDLDKARAAASVSDRERIAARGVVTEGSDALEAAYDCVDAIRHLFVVFDDYVRDRGTLHEVEAAGNEADLICDAAEDSAVGFWDSANAIGL
ncbi:MAG TPA: hypothetical protein VF855_07455, partial [Acidimicrobiales bacterium]